MARLSFSDPPTASELEQLAERVPALRAPLTASQLRGGFTNHNYRIADADGRVWVLRVTEPAEMLGADRDAEYSATVTAAGLGIGPVVLAYLRPERVFVLGFIDGRPVPEAEMRGEDMIRRVAATLLRLHDGPPMESSFSVFGIVAMYRDNARTLGVRLPDEFDWSWARAEEMRAALASGKRPARPCHNDLLIGNFLDEGHTLRILDWEYAGMGDPYFDLANFSTNHELDESGDRMLLEAYFGEYREQDFARLRLMRIMSDFREAMWGVVQQGLRTTDTDYEAYAGQYFDRLRRRATDSQYRRWIEQLT
jgi:thiamine kinase-like enzyme